MTTAAAQVALTQQDGVARIPLRSCTGAVVAYAMVDDDMTHSVEEAALVAAEMA